MTASTNTPAYAISYDTGSPSSNITISGFATSGLFNASTNPTGILHDGAGRKAPNRSGIQRAGCQRHRDNPAGDCRDHRRLQAWRANQCDAALGVGQHRVHGQCGECVRQPTAAGWQQMGHHLGRMRSRPGHQSQHDQWCCDGTGVAQAAGKIATYVYTVRN